MRSYGVNKGRRSQFNVGVEALQESVADRLLQGEAVQIKRDTICRNSNGAKESESKRVEVVDGKIRVERLGGRLGSDRRVGIERNVFTELVSTRSVDNVCSVVNIACGVRITSR